MSRYMTLILVLLAYHPVLSGLHQELFPCDKEYERPTSYYESDVFGAFHQVTLCTGDPLDRIQSAVLLQQGTFLNNLLLHQDAIPILTQAIQLQPDDRNAYIERAIAYFEIGQLQQALKDYESAKNLTPVPRLQSHCKSIYIPDDKTEFTLGLISGTSTGAQVSITELGPSIWNSCRGIAHGLWACICAPIEVSREMVNAAYSVGEFISNHSSEECLHCMVPEIGDLSRSWHRLNDRSRGQKIGYIIGKYGIDIFAPMGALKGISKVQALKRANAMYTLESCTTSLAKQNKILAESSKRHVLREELIREASAANKILIKSPNTQHHIMQSKACMG